MKAIQKELGEGDARTAEMEELRQKIVEAQMPEEAFKAAENELERLRIIPPEIRRAYGGAHLPRVARQPALVRVDARQPRDSARPDRAR